MIFHEKIYLILLISSFQYANAAAVAVLPALPAIGEVIGAIGKTIGIGTVLGLTGDTSNTDKKQCPPCNPPVGSKLNFRYDPPGSHAHGSCPKEQGHWHYEVKNQNTQTCECFNNKSGRYYTCGPKHPLDY